MYIHYWLIDWSITCQKIPLYLPFYHIPRHKLTCSNCLFFLSGKKLSKYSHLRSTSTINNHQNSCHFLSLSKSINFSSNLVTRKGHSIWLTSFHTHQTHHYVFPAHCFPLNSSPACKREASLACIFEKWDLRQLCEIWESQSVPLSKALIC